MSFLLIVTAVEPHIQIYQDSTLTPVLGKYFNFILMSNVLLNLCICIHALLVGLQPSLLQSRCHIVFSFVGINIKRASNHSTTQIWMLTLLIERLYVTIVILLCINSLLSLFGMCATTSHFWGPKTSKWSLYSS